MLSGFLVSLVLHLSLLLMLSLMAFATPVRQSMEMLFAETTEVELPEFALTEDAASEEPEQVAPTELTEFQPEPDVDLQSAKSQMALAQSKDKASPAELDVEKVAASSEADEIADKLGASVSKRVATIQGRVGKAGGRKGEVQFALAWKNHNDVDLHVIAPSGEHISHMHRRSQCNGVLDVDMNVRGESSEPVENIRWLNDAPWGRYTVLVHLFKLNPDGPRRPKRRSDYQLLAQLGNESILKEDSLSVDGEQVFVYRFRYISEKIAPYERTRLLAELDALQSREEAAAAPILADAKAASERVRDRKLENVIRNFPHTDAAIEALQMIGGEISKP